jgi:AcrR family transcriptional regulator
MSPSQGIRTGGRSARVQQSVHAAVRDLLAEHERAELSVPLIAQRAGVTPSTIYRRWGDLQALLSDVAVEHLRPETPPEDTGALESDLRAWARQFLEEMSSSPGRGYVRDVLFSDDDPTNAGQCAEYTRERIGVILERAAGRGEPVPNTESVVDHVVAPMMYRILFFASPPTPEWVDGLLRELLAEGSR